jgi:hypothetical protein
MVIYGNTVEEFEYEPGATIFVGDEGKAHTVVRGISAAAICGECPQLACYTGSDTQEVARDGCVAGECGIAERGAVEILGVMVDMNGWSADNLAFGMGGALLQQLDRDTQKFAMKCSAAEINGEWVPVFKDPVTDRVKASKKGRVTLWTNGTGEFVSGTSGDPKPWSDRGWTNALVEVFRDGKLVKEYTFDEVRANSMK